MFIRIQLFAHKKVQVHLTMVVRVPQKDWAPSVQMVNSFSQATFSFVKEEQSSIPARM